MKYSLFQEGIWVTTGKHNDGSDVLVIRQASPDDKLPDSLLKGHEELEFPDIDTGGDIEKDDENEYIKNQMH